jgi:Protein NO VEIN, C-terminal
MSEAESAGTDWANDEIDLIVADYFDMLKLELQQIPYVKAERNRALQALIGRSRGSIEYKHQNISAVLIEIGLPRIVGYKPMANFQRALVDGVERYLTRPNELSLITEPSPKADLDDPSAIYFGAPPIPQTNTDPKPPFLTSLVRKFDPASRDARNRKLERLGEERVLNSERFRLQAGGRQDLAKKVRWISEEDGDGAGYDILSFSTHGDERLLEVKTTTGGQLTPFYLTENERNLSVERSNAFRLIRLYEFAQSAKAFKLVPPLDQHVILHPTAYRASFDR